MAAGGMYHEKQRLRLCAVHTLNNLFQEERFTKTDFDKACIELSPTSYINPHRSILGLGDYDVNIIIKLLLDNKDMDEKYDVIWFDRRKDPENLSLSNIYGFILNVPSKVKLFHVNLPVMRKHWFAVRRINDIYYNLDSKLDKPKPIGPEADVKSFLKQQIESPNTQLFVVVTSTVASEQSWQKTPDAKT